MIELDSHVRYWVREGRRGSSGRLRRYLSRANLNSSRVQSVRFLMDAGMELNSLGPLWGRVANLMDLILSGAEAEIGGGYVHRFYPFFHLQRPQWEWSQNWARLSPGFSRCIALDISPFFFQGRTVSIVLVGPSKIGHACRLCS